MNRRAQDDEIPAADGPAQAVPRETGPPPATSGDREPTLPTVSRDELDEGWGDGPTERDDEWYRRERPPHWG